MSEGRHEVGQTVRRYALLGAGMRARMYTEAISGPHADVAQLVAIADVNAGRAEIHAEIVETATGVRPRICTPDQLEEVLAQERVDRVIVTTPDLTHADYIVRALEAGVDVVVEKPLTIDADGCRRIAEAVERTGRDVVITFNYRYAPRNAALKRVIQSGEIGTITSVHFEWMLDTGHGADYFRRWHREKANSGGLLVHKSSHHFDLVNWWLHDAPTRVFVSGGLRFYGASNADARGVGERPERGTVDDAASDPFLLDLRSDPVLEKMYLEQEHHDGYRRDQDVFAPGITIEDNLSAVVEYESGASMAYTLTAHAPWEGYTVSVNGTGGRAELHVVERGHLEPGSHIDPSAVPVEDDGSPLRLRRDRLIVQRLWSRAEERPIPEPEGGHGGGDAPLLRDVFHGPQDDDLATAAGWLDGIRSVAVGIAGNLSIAESRAVSIDELALPVSLSRRARS